MRKLIYKYGIYFVFILLFISLSIFYRIYINDDYKVKDESKVGPKTIVRVWMKESDNTDTRKFQIDKYNKLNKDNIIIDFKTYNEDYFNLLRTSLASSNTPDIFEYGYSDLFMENQLYNLNSLGINTDKAISNFLSLCK